MTFGAFIRLFVVMPLAVLVTAALFLLIYLQVSPDPFIFREPGEPNKVYIEIGDRTFPICDCSENWIIPEKPDTSNQWTDSKKVVTEPPTVPEEHVKNPITEESDASDDSVRYCDGSQRSGPRISMPPPQYPQACFAKAAEGSVIVELDIDADGNVTDVEIIKSDDPCFNEAVLSYVRKWKFRPVCDAEGNSYSRVDVQQRVTFKIEK